MPPDYLTSGITHLIERAWLHPGETARAMVTFVSPEHYPASLWVGKTIEVHEGARVVGHATILEVYNPALLG